MPDPIWPTTAFYRLLYRQSLRVGAIRQWEEDHA